MMFDVAALYEGLLIRLGYQTERGVMKAGFVLTKWLKQWPGLEASVWVTLPNADTAYQAQSHMDGEMLVWDVQDTDTAVAGVGKVEVLGMVDGVRKLSAVANTVVEPSILVATSEPPESQQPWYVGALEAAKRAEEAAERAEDGSVPAEVIEEAVRKYLEDNPVGGVTPEEVQGAVDAALEIAKASGEFKGDPGEPGKDGYTPIKGKDYFDGEDGQPGFSPTAHVQQTASGATIAITDKTGTTTATVSNGKDGERGDPGVYVGDSAPSDPEVQVWIDPTGEATAEGTLELIETITLEEDAAIERTAEPDGTPYNFKGAYTRITNSAVIDNSPGNVSYISGSGIVGLGYIPKSQSASKQYCASECLIKYGHWLSRYMNAWTSNQTGISPTQENTDRWLRYTVNDYPTITKIVTPTLTAGMVIEIWGVRA